MLKIYSLFLIAILAIAICSCQGEKFIYSYCGVDSREFKLDYRIYVTEFKIFDENKYDSRPYMIGGIDSLKSKLWYPEIPKRANISGDVIVEFDVNENGYVKNLEVISSPWNGFSEKELESISSTRSPESLKASTGLDKVVSDAILNTEFIPAIKNGDKIKSRIRINVYFYSKSVLIEKKDKQAEKV